jgi:hypothetical protein
LAIKIALIKSIGIIYYIFIRQLTTTIIFINLLLLGKSTVTDLEILVVLVTRLLKQDLNKLVKGIKPVEL